MRLSHRVRHLERLEALAHPLSAMERLTIALNESALRLTGKRVDEVRTAADVSLVSDDVQHTFVEKLSTDDLIALLTGLETVAADSEGL